ncbi:MAG: SHOCT domain-containing protein, partial [Planctomycetota bacterium]
NSSRRRSIPLALLAGSLLATPLLGGCAFVVGNSGRLHLSRNISVGQELMDLKEARDTGAISDAEYIEMKAKLLEAMESIEIVGTINENTPDELRLETEQ